MFEATAGSKSNQYMMCVCVCDSIILNEDGVGNVRWVGEREREREREEREREREREKERERERVLGF